LATNREEKICRKLVSNETVWDFSFFKVKQGLYETAKREALERGTPSTGQPPVSARQPAASALGPGAAARPSGTCTDSEEGTAPLSEPATPGQQGTPSPQPGKS